MTYIVFAFVMKSSGDSTSNHRIPIHASRLPPALSKRCMGAVYFLLSEIFLNTKTHAIPFLCHRGTNKRYKTVLYYVLCLRENTEHFFLGNSPSHFLLSVHPSLSPCGQVNYSQSVKYCFSTF